MDDLLEELEPKSSTDPWKLVLIVGTVVFAAAAAIFMLRASSNDQACTFEDQVSPQLEGKLDSIRAAFSASSLSYAPALLASVESELAKRASELNIARRTACKANSGGTELAAAHHPRALACLEDNERRLLMQIDRWSRADDGTIKAVAKALIRLPEPAQCLEVGTLLGRPPPPPSALAEQVDQLTRELDEAKGMRDLGKLEPAKVGVESLITKATELGYAPLLAQALHERGAIARGQSEALVASEFLKKAYVAAQEGEAKALGTMIAGELAYALAIGKADAKAASMWRDLLEVDANKGTGGPSVEFRALDMLGAIYDFQGDYAKALEFRQRAHALALKEHADVAMIVAKAEGNMGLSWHALGKLKEAAESYEKALAILEKAVGALHPQRATLLANAGLANAELGNTLPATEQLSAALAIHREVYGERSIEAGYTLLNLAIAYQSGDRLDDAIATYDRSLAIVIERLGADHPDVALVHNSKGTAFEAKGDFQEALVASSMARAIFEAKDLDHPEIARIVYNQATVRKKMGDVAQALRLHRDAIARWQKVDANSPYVAAPLIAVAEILIETGKPVEANVALERAQAMSSQLSDEQNKRIVELLAKTN